MLDRPQSSTAGSRLTPMLGAAFAVLFAVVFPRSTALLWGLLVGLMVAFVIGSRGSASVRAGGGSAAVAGAAFVGWAIASTLWSLDPLASATKPLFLIAIVAGLTLLASMLARTGAALWGAVAQGILGGVLLSGAILAFEIWSGQAIARAIYNAAPSLQAGYEKHLTLANGTVVHVSEGQINRRVTVLSMLLVAGVAIALRTLAGRARLAALALLGVIALAVLSVTGHQSSQLAVAAGAATLALAAVAPQFTRALVAVVWIVVVMTMPLIATWLYQSQTQSLTALPNSARHRVVIWKDTSDQIAQRPVLGIGADASAALARQRNEGRADPGDDGEYGRSIARHAHNGFLQVWHELGAVGALLFMAAGLALLANSVAPSATSYFAVAAAMMAVSYSIWQIWFQATFALGLAALLVANRSGPDETH